MNHESQHIANDGKHGEQGGAANGWPEQHHQHDIERGDDDEARSTTHTVYAPMYKVYSGFQGWRYCIFYSKAGRDADEHVQQLEAELRESSDRFVRADIDPGNADRLVPRPGSSVQIGNRHSHREHPERFGRYNAIFTALEQSVPRVIYADGNLLELPGDYELLIFHLSTGQLEDMLHRLESGEISQKVLTSVVRSYWHWGFGVRRSEAFSAEFEVKIRRGEAGYEVLVLPENRMDYPIELMLPGYAIQYVVET